jgi:hypothetical protein
MNTIKKKTLLDGNMELCLEVNTKEIWVSYFHISLHQNGRQNHNTVNFLSSSMYGECVVPVM